ncbi:hypothetical protein PF008_g25901 [Phytophthora fragariae]|uniref:Uncharacterized protein n=1 Tax=Phytophthora fragariae TaxID=53985 RepID=A0A6G0QIK4_9STRA|nr:hypothetical protein PF008_g25901 [Phytophthora fragariae]
MKANIAGGPSIIFNRYAKRNETKVRGGKVCKKIIGYDANALYLWAITCVEAKGAKKISEEGVEPSISSV